MVADVSTNRIKGNHSRFLSLIGLQGQFLLAEHTHHVYHPSSVKSSEKADLGPKGETWPLQQHRNPLQDVLCEKCRLQMKRCQTKRNQRVWDKHLQQALPCSWGLSWLHKNSEQLQQHFSCTERVKHVQHFTPRKEIQNTKNRTWETHFQI